MTPDSFAARARDPRKPLTPQEALEKFGYIVANSVNPYPLNKQWANVREGSGVPLGALLVMIEEISKAESDYWNESVGWSAPAESNHFYKAVAE